MDRALYLCLYYYLKLIIVTSTYHIIAIHVYTIWVKVLGQKETVNWWNIIIVSMKINSADSDDDYTLQLTPAIDSSDITDFSDYEIEIKGKKITS